MATKETGTITLFDLPSRPPCTTWSMNPWKTRLLFNYKGVDYKTEWTEYPDIKGKLESHVPANEAGPSFTIPTIRLPDGTYIMDSSKIVSVIDETYPQPPLHLDSPFLPKIEALIAKLKSELRSIYMPRVPKRILNGASVDYFLATRAKLVGKSLDQLEKETDADAVWKNAGPALREITALLEENPDGPFLMGRTVSYADFVWAGFLLFYQRLGQDVFEALLASAGDGEVHLKLLEAVSPWSERNDH